MIAAAYRRADGGIDRARGGDIRRRRADAAPLGIVAKPRDIALTILYLAAEARCLVTGQVLRPNGCTAMPWAGTA